MKKLIMSDFFGVVGDEDSTVFFGKYCPQYKAQDLTDKYFHPGDRGEVTFEEIVDNVCKDFNFERDFVLENLLEGPKPHRSYINVLRKLKEEGHKLVLLSNACDFLVPYLIKRYEIEDLFDELYISYEIGHYKPNEDAFLYALEKSGYKPEDSYFIDDNKENVTIASSLGINGLLYINDENTIDNIYKTIHKN